MANHYINAKTIDAVELDPSVPGMIRITMMDGSRWHYYPGPGGTMEIGQPIILVNRDYTVYLFVPFGPGAIPILLDVRSNDTE